MTNRFQRTLARQNDGHAPIWMMRQAGRYHSHYQGMRKQHSFTELCKNPDLATEVAMGPIRDFDFDAAILFSDILFPLEVLGMPLDFAPGPQLGFHIKTLADVHRLSNRPDVDLLGFQAEALTKTRAALPVDKGLIGFVGGLLTLFVFAVEGTHKNGIEDAITGLTDGRFDALMDKLQPLMLQNLLLQAEAKPDVIAIFDSAAGDIPLDDYKNIYLPRLTALVNDYDAHNTGVPLLYYGKGCTPVHYEWLSALPFVALGIDHHQDMPFDKLGNKLALQGNLDPEVLTLSPAECQKELDAFFTAIKNVPAEQRRGWICGLGHGITPAAHEENVRAFVAACRAAG